MATLIEVKGRIQSIRSTQKLTKAMKMVAAAKLRKNEVAQKALKPFTAEVELLVHEMASYKRWDPHPLMVVRNNIKKIGYIFISADRGLCGAFNSNLFRQAQAIFDEKIKKGNEISLYIVGLKARQYYEKRGINIAYSRVRIEKENKREIAREISAKVSEAFLKGELDKIKIIYTRYHSSVRHHFEEKSFLPLSVKDFKKTEVEPIYEEDFHAVLNFALPFYLESVLLSAILESATAEEASRMVAMDYATENAEELISDLTLFYNRTRQSVITKEISEIVGGAEALRNR